MLVTNSPTPPDAKSGIPTKRRKPVSGVTIDMIKAPLVIMAQAQCLVIHVPHWSSMKPKSKQMKLVAMAEMVKMRLKCASW